MYIFNIRLSTSIRREEENSKLKTNNTLRTKYKTAKEFIKQENLKAADEYLEECLTELAIATLKGQTHIEGTSVNLWKTRVWSTIERAGLLP